MKPRNTTLCLLATLIVFSAPVSGFTWIDSFGASQGQLTVTPVSTAADSFVSHVDILGGERDLSIFLASAVGTASVEVTGDKLTITNSGGATSVVTLQYDGIDMSEFLLPDGLGPMSLGMDTSFASIVPQMTAAWAAIDVELFTQQGIGIGSSRTVWHATTFSSSRNYHVPFPLFTNTLNSQALGSMVVNITLGENGILELEELNFVQDALGCGLPAVHFENDLPPSFAAFGSELSWTTTADASCSMEGTGENRTGGAGHAACADSDAAGGGALPYVASFQTNPFFLPPGLVTSATLRFKGYYRDVVPGNDVLTAIDSSGTQVGSILFWDEDHAGEVVEFDFPVDESPRYVVFTYQGDGFDWYAQIDEIELICEVSVFSDGFESGNTTQWTSTTP